MERRNGSAREDQFLGALLGFAIGDALGRQVTGLTANQIAARSEPLDEYTPFADGEVSGPTGEITAATEIMLCIVESITTNSGMVDPENINARLGFLAHGPSREWMSPATIEGIAQAGAVDGLVSDGNESAPELAVALRGVPVGLLHAVGGFEPSIMERDAELVARLSHGSVEQRSSVSLVANIVRESARSRAVPGSIASPADDIGRAVATIAGTVISASTFEEGVVSVIRQGGPANETGALAGGILGAAGGASSIPQELIDGLDARIYLSLAAPWFFRAAQRRAGTVIDLRVVDERG